MGILFNEHFIPAESQIKRFVALFGVVLEGVHIRRSSSPDEPDKHDLIEVPVVYANGETRYKINDQSPIGEKQRVYYHPDNLIGNAHHHHHTHKPLFNGNIPVISYELMDITRDGTKTTNTNARLPGYVQGNSGISTKVPIQYSLRFEVNVRTKYLEDAMMISEQFLSVFTPDVTIKYEIQDGYPTQQDIAITIEDLILIEDNSVNQLTEIKYVNLVMNFLLSAPIKQREYVLPIVKQIDINRYIESDYIIPWISISADDTQNSNNATIDIIDYSLNTLNKISKGTDRKSASKKKMDCADDRKPKRRTATKKKTKKE